MTHEMDLTELQELRKQFNLIDEKLDRQHIINEELLRESMKSKLSRVELWYRIGSVHQQSLLLSSE